MNVIELFQSDNGIALAALFISIITFLYAIFGRIESRSENNEDLRTQILDNYNDRIYTFKRVIDKSTTILNNAENTISNYQSSVHHDLKAKVNETAEKLKEHIKEMEEFVPKLENNREEINNISKYKSHQIFRFYLNKSKRLLEDGKYILDKFEKNVLYINNIVKELESINENE